MNIFEDPSLNLSHIGHLRKHNSQEVSDSALGIGFETLDREMFDPEICYDLFAATGAKWARCQTGWCRCERVKGLYDFAWLDSVVDNLVRRGIRPWFNIGYGNSLYMPGIPHEAAVGCVPTGYGEECENAWKNFISALAGHFKDRVKYWEIWNEPNLNDFWIPLKASGSNLTGLVAITAPIIKRIDPDARISSCCSGIDFPFVQEALEAGIGKYLDGFAIHPYAAMPELNYFENIAALKQLFKIYAPHLKLEQGECGYPSQTYGHHDSYLISYFASETTQARYVLRRIVLDSMAEMERISYFHLTDLIAKTYRLADGSPRNPIRLGLLRGEDYTPKLSYHAYCNMGSIFDSLCKVDHLHAILKAGWDLRQAGSLPFLAPVIGTFSRKNYPLYAYYYPEDLQRCWSGRNDATLQTLPKQSGLQELKNPVLIDTISGNVYSIADTEVTVRGYLWLKGLPLTDYPLIITDINAIDILS